MGGVANTTKKAFNDTTSQFKTLVTHPSKLNLGQALNLSTAGGLSPLTQAANAFSGGSPTGPKPNTAFNFDPNQSANDQAAINTLGQQQYQDTLKGIDANAASQNTAAANFFQQSLPNIAESSQAAHLYDSTGYGQEVARQQAALANAVSSQTAQAKLGALGSLQGYQTGAVQRGMSLEDFTNQANVAKAIGAQMVPQAPSSKATGMSGAAAGAGTGATVGTSFLPGWGTAIGAGVGGLAGYAGGANINKQGGK